MPQSKKEDFEDKVDEQEASVERLQKEDSDLQAKKKEVMAGEEAAMAAVKKHQVPGWQPRQNSLHCHADPWLVCRTR